MNVETVTGNEQQEADSCEQEKNAKSANARVERFRNGLREQDCARLDVWIGSAWVRGLVFLARHQKRPLWALVQEAVRPYLAQNNIVFKSAPRDRVR